MSVPRIFAKLEDPTWNDVHGGAGGVHFDDLLTGGDAIRAIWISSGSLIDSVQIAYRNDRKTSRHGGLGGKGHWHDFVLGEMILEVSGYTERYVSFLSIRTTHRLIEAGRPGLQAKPFSIKAPDGHHLIGLHGRCGNYLDAIGARIEQIPPPRHDPADLAQACLQKMKPVRFVADGRGTAAPR